MNVLYLDESGDPNSWNNQNHFVIAGASVHEGQIRYITEAMDQVQREYFPDISIPLSFHASDIRAGNDRYRSMSEESRMDLLESLYNSIVSQSRRNIKLFATAIHISAVTSNTMAISNVFEDVCIRFNHCLTNAFRRGSPGKGLLIIDRAHEDRYRQLLSQFRNDGTSHGYIGNIVDIPYFARRHDTRMLQVADLIAFAVFRYYEKNDDTFFKIILSHFDRRSPRSIDGLKHITTQPCSCEACH